MATRLPTGWSRRRGGLVSLLFFGLLLVVPSARAAGTPPANTVRPAISGNARYGQTLTATQGSWTGTEPITYTNQWRRCDTDGNNCFDIPSATGLSHTLATDDIGARVVIRVTAANDYGTTVTRSWLSAVVVSAPINTVRPSLSGIARSGETITVSPGTWVGTAPIAYTYQWRRCDSDGSNCSDVPGASGASYLLSSADVGRRVHGRVTATNTFGTNVIRSWNSAVIAAAALPAVAPPAAPAAYALPAGATKVSTPAQLIAALGQSTATDIVLADGVYGTTGWFANHSAHRLYAENLGGAVLTSGIEIGANWGSGGAVVRGLVFDVSDPARAFMGGVIHVWGPNGNNTRVLDCEFRGHDAIAFGLYAPNPTGLVAERLVFKDFTDVALRASDNQATSYGSATPHIQRITDIDVDGVSRAIPGSSNGTAEAGVWIGHPVTDGVHRVRVRHASWSGIETVNNAWNTAYTDLDIDMSGPQVSSGVGVYLEHFNYSNTFERFTITAASMGFTAEWADPDWGGVAGAHNTVIRSGVIDAAGSTKPKTWGVYLDEGTESTTITGVVFRSQSFAAIGAYKTVGTNVFENNDTSGILSGALPISYAHWSSPSP